MISSRQGMALAASIAFAPLSAAGSEAAVTATDIAGVSVAGTEFVIRRGDGTVLTREETVGARLTVRDAAGGGSEIRIDDVMTDPADPAGEILLYRLSARDPASGEWVNLCAPGPDGLAMGFPLAGTWTDTGEHLRSEASFSITCTGGASGKCLRMGYKPWKTGPNGESLWDLHQACTRMVRADYCGDGTSFTRDGTAINVYDGLGIQRRDAAPELSFEAAWGPQGALCVAKTRVPENGGLETLRQRCPARLEGRLGDACNPDGPAVPGQVLLRNDS